jgi:hypothetical protein
MGRTADSLLFYFVFTAPTSFNFVQSASKHKLMKSCLEEQRKSSLGSIIRCTVCHYPENCPF